MRATYDLTVPAKDKKKFKSALKTLGITYDYEVMTNGTDLPEPLNRYIVKLSKYEFLYIRLAANVIDAINVDEWKIENEKTVSND